MGFFVVEFVWAINLIFVKKCAEQLVFLGKMKKLLFFVPVNFSLLLWFILVFRFISGNDLFWSQIHKLFTKHMKWFYPIDNLLKKMICLSKDCSCQLLKYLQLSPCSLQDALEKKTHFCQLSPCSIIGSSWTTGVGISSLAR